MVAGKMTIRILCGIVLPTSLPSRSADFASCTPAFRLMVDPPPSDDLLQ
eukprot:CAMPEP_0183502670 /NCGR_PEP_ID=MMETSP0371-20130417/4402_1 /TAXON_ID=268820 /ORGANISM="Peridinium aciculiferum, Strain PAER-2" /LENGTH=48 /DNA_ID= /DNA_START= /DNA_END= /DNA_ORIENTATION=